MDQFNLAVGTGEAVLIGQSPYTSILVAAILLTLGCVGCRAVADAVAVVTAASPARVAAKVPELKTTDANAYVVISVLAFKPAEHGTVAMTARLLRNGELLGDPAGFFPADTEFRAKSPSEVQHFQFPLPKGELVENAGGTIPIEVALKAISGSAEGARIEIGDAEIKLN
jgi:hypothetical protein